MREEALEMDKFQLKGPPPPFFVDGIRRNTSIQVEELNPGLI